MNEKIKKIQREVGLWSKQNFGRQETDKLAVAVISNPNNDKGKEVGETLVCLDHIAPLMGLAEELGELAAARTTADKRDALGDIGIYFCDYLARMGLNWPEPLPPADLRVSHDIGIVASIGELFHCNLKRLQNIRSMNKPVQFFEVHDRACANLAWHLQELAKERSEYGPSFEALLEGTWSGIVKKRNWQPEREEAGVASDNG